MSMFRTVVIAGTAAIVTCTIGTVGSSSAQAAPAACLPAGSTGLTAAVVLQAGASATGNIDAHGCDVGVYIGPGADGARVTGATVFGANDHGVFVQDADGVVVAHNTVTGNGVHRTNGIAEDKAIEMAGSRDSTVFGNRVVHNDGGGIGLADDGGLDPGAPVGHPGSLRSSVGNLVTGNVVSDNLNDCAIVVTAKNHGTAARANSIVGNDVDDVPGVFPPALGGIVLAGQEVVGNDVVGNTIRGSFMPGIIVHSSRPDTDVSDNVIANNVLTEDDWGRINGPAARVAIILATASQPAGRLDHTVIANNRIAADEDYGIYLIGATHTVVAADQRNQASVPVYGS
jgi:hypothetical protein